MPNRTNRHITKFNQLVEVYDPDEIGPLERIGTRNEKVLQARKTETRELRETVERLSTEDFFDEQRKQEMEENKSHPAPAEAAASQREDMLDRLDEIDRALADAMADHEMLETPDELDF